MIRDYLVEATMLRDAALAELRQHPAFQAFTVLDNAVVSLGGSRSGFNGAATESASVISVLAERARNRAEIFVKGAKPLSQGDAAEQVLRELDIPVRLSELLAAVEDKGVKVSGADPAANFRSTISRDDRFYSLKHDGQYLWWLTGVTLPRAWIEATEYGLLAEPVASLPFSSLEGGEPIAPTT